MSRELNKELFPDLVSRQGSESVPHQKRKAQAESLAPILKEDWQILVGQIDIIKRRLRDLESRHEAFQNRVGDWNKNTQSRFERFNSAGARMEQFLKGTIQEINEKLAQLSSRVAERRLQENKIQEMMDRHNQVLQGYETRLSQVQKLVHEQEIQLMGTKSALEDAHREIVRLRRL